VAWTQAYGILDRPVTGAFHGRSGLSGPVTKSHRNSEYYQCEVRDHEFPGLNLTVDKARFEDSENLHQAIELHALLLLSISVIPLMSINKPPIGSSVIHKLVDEILLMRL
jgi:hypothetical protein